MDELDDQKADLIEEVQDVMSQMNAKQSDAVDESATSFGNSLIHDINDCETQREIEDCKRQLEHFQQALKR